MPEAEPLVDVSVVEIAISMAPLVVIAFVSSTLKLDIESAIVISTIRTFVQLSILAFILNPIFTRGVEEWWLVTGYCFLMILLASFEGSTRSKYYVDGQFFMVFYPMSFNVVAVSLFAFYAVIKPEPRWDPQYVIPIVGMLLGNCINGVSLALNSLFTSLIDCSREVELLLSFGANRDEATSRLVREAVRTGTIPQLNSMAIIGLISIPGMMTGQILGGTPVMQAARYQILIVYFIAMCAFGTIIMELKLALRLCFDSKSIFRTNVLKKRDKKPNIFSSIVEGIFSKNKSRPRAPSFTLHVDDELTYLAPQGGVNIMVPSPMEIKQTEKVIVRVKDLSYGFEIQNEKESEKSEIRHEKESTVRTLFKNLSFDIRAGAMALVMGPSGAGKSTLLRIIAGLTDVGGENINVDGNTQVSCVSMSFWRKRVRYVPQTKVDIPGTPNDFITKITSFKTWKGTDDGVEMRSYFEMKNKTRELARKWGINTDLLNSEWKVLSGGESQRILVAIALASLGVGSVILLDESTSALDLATKIEVEKSVQEYCTKLSAVAIWISHDPGQKDRMKLDASV